MQEGNVQIAILTPTRNRIKRYTEFLDSIRHTKSQNANIRCYAYIDDDDPALEKYKNLNYQGLHTDHTYGESQSISKSWNNIAQKAISEGADVLVMGNDDQIYITKNWDLSIQQLHQKHTDGIYCAWFNDNINQERHCAFPIISKTWYNTLGYFTPGVFNFGYNDTWIYDIGKRVGRCVYISNVLCEHRHLTTNRSKYNDDTYARNRTQKRGNLYAKDKVIFNATGDQREDDANKLKQVIRDYR